MYNSIMGSLRSAWELASERVIASRFQKPTEAKPKGFDFIKVEDFNDREDKALNVVGYSDGTTEYAPETKLIEDPEEERKKVKEEPPMNDIRVQAPEIIHSSEQLECCFCGSTKSYSGYSKMNRNLIFGLSNRNVKVKVEDLSDSFDVNEETQKQIAIFENNEITPKSPKIYSMTVPDNVCYNGRKIAYTMMESSSLHKDYCSKLNLMEELWVPSIYGKKLMEKSHINPPIHVMPLGVDTLRYKPDCGKMNFGQAMRSFKFLCISKYSIRKGFDVLLKAYMEEFSGEEDVSLLLVTNPLHTAAGKQGAQIIVDDFNDLKGNVKKSDEELPHIALYLKPTMERDVPKIYNSCNAFCLISRGEGFSLTIFEAAACGLPVIASNVTAHTDVLKPDNSFLVEPDGYREVKINGHMSQIAKSCHFYDGQLFPDFSETGIEQTKKQMRYVFENYKEAKIKAEKLRNLVLHNYTWDMGIDKVHNRLRELHG